MRLVIWEDNAGLKHGAYVRDGDSDDMAEYGIQVSPPDVVNLVDWRLVAQEIYNKLVEHNLFTWDDVLKKQKSVKVSSIIQSALNKRVITLYRLKEQEDKSLESEDG